MLLLLSRLDYPGTLGSSLPTELANPGTAAILFKGMALLISRFNLRRCFHTA